MELTPQILQEGRGVEPEIFQVTTEAQMSSPTELVLYTLADHDIDQINQTVPVIGTSARPNLNPPSVGQEYPALVVRDFGDSQNLKVFLDGGPGAEYWATSRQEGTGPGKWHR
jgi:hypothetical protein